MAAQNPKKTEVKEIHLKEYYLILLKHRLLIFTCLLLSTGAAIGLLAWLQPTYESTATLSIKSSQPVSPLTGESLEYQSYFTQNLTFKTHFQLVTSRPVLERVISQLRLDESDEGKQLGPGPVQVVVEKIKHNLRLLIGKKSANLSEKEKSTKLLTQLRDKIQVKRVTDTMLLQIIVAGNDPVLAADIANTLARVYVQFDISKNRQTTQNSYNMLSDESYELKKKLENAEKEFLAFRQQENLFSFEGKQEFVSQKITEFNNLVVENRYKLQELEVKLNELQSLKAVNALDDKRVRSLLDNQVLDKLNQQLIDARIELTQLGKVYGDKHPKIVKIRDLINDTDREISRQVENELAKMRNQQAVLLAKEKSLQQNIDGLEKESLAISQKELQYTALQRNVETYREHFDILLVKLKESDIISNIKGEPTVTIVEEAQTPLYPAKPDKKKFLLGAIFLGLFGGIGFTFFLEYLDQTLRTEDDVQRYLELPVISVVPIAGQAGTGYGYGHGKRVQGGNRTED